MRNSAALLPLLVASSAHGVTLFPAGAESKSTGMESALKARGAPAVLYNPANLTQTSDDAPRPTPYAELGVINVNYTYEHPQFDPVNVVVTSPTATIGYAQRFGSRLAVGAVIFPSAAGKTTIPGLPRKVGSSVVAVTAEAEDDVMDLGLGVGVEALPGLSVGLAVVRTEEKHVVKAELPNSVQPLVDMSYHNTFHRPVLGIHYAPGSVSAALAYRPALTKSYDGSAKSSVDQDASAPKVKGYEPQTVSLGLEARLGRVTFAAEAQRQAWGKGRTDLKNGIDQDLPEADLQDVVSRSVSVGYYPRENARLTASYAQLPTPWGDGRDTGELSEHVYGVDFGQMNGIDLSVTSFGTHVEAFGGEATLELFHARGEREVAGDGDNVGYYTLGITSVSGGFRKPF